jgi:hypothetical protein
MVMHPEILAFGAAGIVAGLIVSAVMAGASVAVGLLTRPKQSFMHDNSAPVLTERGSPLPVLIGRRRIPGFLCWAGARTTTSSGGGGSGLGGGAGGGETYHEMGWHVLCVGPVSRLTAIYENGKAIWTGDVTPTDSPSGTHLATKKGNAYIYWGEFDQGPDPILSAKLGTVSGWPCICYVFWNKKNLGSQATWPVLEYELEARIFDKVLADSDDWLDMTVAPTTSNTQTFVTPTLDTAHSLGAVGIINAVVKVGTAKKKLNKDYTLDASAGEVFFLSSGSISAADTVVVTFDTSGDGTDGPNPAHVLWQLMTAPAPYGCAIPPAYIDGAAFETMGELFVTEHQSCHILATGGISGMDLVGQILTDAGVMLPQVGDVLTPVPVRHEDAGDLPVITSDMLVTPAPPPRQQVHEAALPDRLVFTIKDRANNFRDLDVVIDDDSQAILRSRTKQEKIEIPTVVDRRTALLVADRRTQEILTNAEKYEFSVARGARMLRPGQAIILDGYGQLRVVSVEQKVQSRTAVVNAILDQYSGEPGTYVPTDINDSFDGSLNNSPEPDTIVVVQQLPADQVAQPSLGILRVRANDQIIGANVWLSSTGTSYSQAGTQNAPAAGGTLQTAIAAADSSPIATGPVITAYNDDIEAVEDLTGRDAEWEGGEQIAIIDSEIFFLQKVTAVVGGWRLDGLIRAQYSTTAADHAIGASVLIIPRRSITPIASTLIASGNTIYVKTQPVTTADAADLSDVTAVTITIP